MTSRFQIKVIHIVVMIVYKKIKSIFLMFAEFLYSTLQNYFKFTRVF